LSEESIPTALREIRQNIPSVCSGFWKKRIDGRRKQQYFSTENAEWLDQGINLYINIIAKTYETDYEMPRSSGVRRRKKCRKLRRWVVSLY
jgi:hypothetical protein